MQRFSDEHLSGLINIQKSAGRLTSEDASSQLVFHWPGRFRPRWHRFNLTFDTPINGIPRLSFHFADDELYAENCVLEPVSREEYRCMVFLPEKPREVRLAPTDTSHSYSIKSFSVTQLSSLGIYASGSLRLMRTLVSNPAHFITKLRRGLEIATSKSVTGVRLTDDGSANRQDIAYEDWRRIYDFDLENHEDDYRRRIENLGARPLISVVMPTYNTPLPHLEAAIRSVQSQLYDNWQLCIADDASTSPAIREALSRWAVEDERIRLTLLDTNGHISRASNAALELATGDWTALMDHDDVLAPHALAEIAFEADRYRDAVLIYSDEDKIDDAGNRLQPHFKPDYSPDLFLGMNYFNHLTAIRTSALRNAGGWRQGFEGSQDYDLFLRVIESTDASNIRHIPKVLYHWRITKGSTAQSADAKSYAWDAGKKALEEHLARTQQNETSVGELPGTPYYRIRRPMPETAPRVTLIIPTRDKHELLETCVQSILAKTTYPAFDILVVNNQSEAPETLAFFERITAEDPRVKVIDYPNAFNYSAINNFAASQTDADIIGLVNNDVEVISPDWLTEMVIHACRSDVACVGAKLYYSDNTIQHAGVIVGIGGVAGHAHKYFPQNSLGYFSRLVLPQNLSAVTGACMVVRRNVYNELGGLDEDNLTIGFNDVDFCLRAREAGYLNVWTPFAELYHHESKTRGLDNTPDKIVRARKESRYMKERWAKVLMRDPYYNPNLSDTYEDFSYRRQR